MTQKLTLITCQMCGGDKVYQDRPCWNCRGEGTVLAHLPDYSGREPVADPQAHAILDDTYVVRKPRVKWL